MRTSNSLYTLLQVLPTADPAVIEAAYKALMKKHHPDLHHGEDAQRRAAEISHAFNVLRDPERRSTYDADERAREERYKVELARAFPEASAAGASADGARRNPPPAARFEPPQRPEQRVAAWIGISGILALALTIVLLARGGAEPVPSSVQQSAPAVQVADLDEALANPSSKPVPFRDEPVSTAQVTNAVVEFNRISSTEGLEGAVAFSERCFDTQNRTMSLGEFDHCVAFDHAAGRAEYEFKETPQPATLRRFQPQNQIARHIRAADPLADTFSSIEIRLYEIRRLTDAALVQLANSAPAVGQTPPQSQPRAAVAAAPRYVEAPATQRRTRAPPRQRTPKREQDFLEREGGIY
jgi:curved DNA-binding protein CbpA